MAFMLYEIMMWPFAFLRSYYTVLFSSQGLFTTTFNLFRWTIIGNLMGIFILLKDILIILDLLRMHDGTKAHMA